jgi:hypothetical protein
MKICHWKPHRRHIFQLRTSSNNNMANRRTCEAWDTLSVSLLHGSKVIYGNRYWEINVFFLSQSYFVEYCHGLGGCAWLIDGFLIGGFIDTLYTQLGATVSYSAIADLHTLQFTVTRTSVLSLHWSYPCNGFIIVSLSLQTTQEVFVS